MQKHKMVAGGRFGGSVWISNTNRFGSVPRDRKKRDMAKSVFTASKLSVVFKDNFSRSTPSGKVIVLCVHGT